MTSGTRKLRWADRTHGLPPEGSSSDHVGPVVEPVLLRLDGLRRLVPEHDESPHHGRDVDRLPVPVQDQCGKLQYVAGHRRLRQGRSEGVRRGLNPSPRAPQTRVLPLHHGHHRKGGRIHRLAPERKGRESNPQGSHRLARFPGGSRLRSGGPSVSSVSVGDAGVEPRGEPPGGRSSVSCWCSCRLS